MLRVGCPESLAARLYIDNLGDRVPPHTVTHQTPARLAGMLAGAELDVALIPAPLFYERADHLLVPDCSVSCQGESLTAFLCLRKPLPELERVGLDAGHPCESMLVRVLLAERDGLSPEYVASPRAAERAKDKSLDAFLSCGELGAADGCGELDRIDLGEAWWRFARLPMVFSVWVTREGVDLAGFDKALLRAKRDGLRHARKRAGEAAAELGLPGELVVEYLTRELSCDLTTVEVGGMETFHRYAVKCGLSERSGAIEFYR